MSFKEPTQPLRDILESVRMIEDFTAGMSFEQFRGDPKTVAAAERKFLVIGAAVRLGREAPLTVAGVPWRQIRDLGNLLGHAYDNKVDLEIIWQTITDDLPPLKVAVLKALQPPGNPKASAPD